MAPVNQPTHAPHAPPPQHNLVRWWGAVGPTAGAVESSSEAAAGTGSRRVRLPPRPRRIRLCRSTLLPPSASNLTPQQRHPPVNQFSSASPQLRQLPAPPAPPNPPVPPAPLAAAPAGALPPLVEQRVVHVGTCLTLLSYAMVRLAESAQEGPLGLVSAAASVLRWMDGRLCWILAE
ncbi:unnamed protein product [Closterium sp. NIES-65]|nr:unnamed protein product [Closterium sp. NIES-65]